MKTRSVPKGFVVAAGVAGVALVGVVTAQVVSSPAPSPGTDQPAPYELFLSFNGTSVGPPDLTSSGSASVAVSITSAGQGEVVAVEDGTAGEAARFEPFDPDVPARLAAIVIRPNGDDPFSPAGDAFTFGADFRLDAESEGSEVDNGNNLVQRGLYGEAAQYKLQIDGDRLSCRISGSAGSVTVTSPELAPGRWHLATCTRRSSTITLVLSERIGDVWTETGVWKRSGAIGSLEYGAGAPLSVGSKVDSSGEVIATDSDQFNGQVDNVFFQRLGG